LVDRRGRVQSRDQLLSDVWGYSADVTTRTVDTHIKRLREKLGVIWVNMFKQFEVLVINLQEHQSNLMGIRSRIFFIVFVLLTISIAITYVVAERDLNNTFKQQTINELEKRQIY
jgi:hypothetical protein